MTVAEIWRKSEPELAALTRKPSEQIIEHMAFTPLLAIQHCSKMEQ